MNAAVDTILRDWHPSDALALMTCLNNRQARNHPTYPHSIPYTIRHARVFIGMANCRDTKTEKAIEHDQQVIGGITLIPDEDGWSSNAELRFFLQEGWKERGILVTAINKATAYAFGNFGFERLYTYILKSNLHDRQTLLESGFEQEGILRRALLIENQFHDVCLFSILK